jgi:ATP-dependent helicase/nuclease subunit B
MLTVRYGPFQPSLENAFLSDLAALKDEDSLASVAVVTPSRRLADRLQRLVALESGRAYLGVTFHTFYSLALEVTAESENNGRKIVRESMFFDRLLDSLIETPKNGPRPKGLAAAYRSSLKDLIDSGIGPSAVSLLEEGILKEDLGTRRLSHLLKTLKKFDKKMKEIGVLPSSALTERALSAARSGSPALGKYKRFLYYGFYDLTGLQADFFEAVAKDYPVTLYFPYRKGHPAFSFADRFFETKLHFSKTAPERLDDGVEGRALGTVLDALFQPGKTGAAKEGALRFISASGGQDEVWRTAKEILRLVEEDGYRYGDIGVVARTIEPYRSSICNAFHESHIPYFSGAEEPLLRRPAARLCMTLLTLGRRDFPAIAVLDLVGAPCFKGSAEKNWRRLVERLRIHRGWLQWEGKLKPVTRGDFELFPHLENGEIVSKKESAALWTLLEGWKETLSPVGAQTWSYWVDYARTFIESVLDPGDDPGYAAFKDALSRFKTFDMLGEETGFPEFLEAVEDRLTRLSRPSEDHASGGVRVLNAMDARGESFKALFLLGMQEGLFPRTIREDPLLRDAARSALNRDGGYWISSKQAGYEEEKLLFYILCAAADEKLYCSFPRSDENGRAQVQSIYLYDLCSAAGREWPPKDILEYVPRPPQQKLCDPKIRNFLSPKELSVAAALRGEDARNLHRAFKLDAAGYHALAMRAEGLNRGGKPGEMDGIVGPPEEYLTSLKRRGLSPSALEMLARCPFQFYASYVLGLDEPEEPSQAGVVSPVVKGEIYHALLRGVYDRMRRGGYWKKADRTFPESELRAQEQEVFTKFTWRELGVYPLLWAITLRGMRAHIRRFLTWDLARSLREGWIPAFFETELRADLPLTLSGKAPQVPFQGRADRIDVQEGRFQVVDYKTRWKKPGTLERAASKGELFQPTLYRELAGDKKELKGLQGDGVRFFALEAEDDKTEHVYGEEFHRANLKDLYMRLSESVERIAAGRFVIRPDDGEFGHCRWCSFGDLCRKNHPMSLARAQESGDE